MNEDEFIKYLKDLNIEVSKKQLDQLNKYYEHLISYNKNINITAITKKEEVYLKHFYDSLTLTKAIDFTKISNLCDVGTGAGFPGLVLKIFFPNIKLTLVESITKKTNFLREIIELLNLKDVNVINERVETFATNNKDKFEIVVCRALSKLNIISELCIPIVKVNGYFVPMKGKIEEELENLLFLRKLNIIIEKIYEFNLPIENSLRNLVKLKKIKETELIYPRNFKTIKEKPL